jgi:hypothetical protein
MGVLPLMRFGPAARACLIPKRLIFDSSIDIGVDSTTSERGHLEENAGAVDLKLSDDDVARLEAVLRPEAVSGLRYNEKIMAGIDR